MSNTLADPGPYDALGKARPNEPIFPVVGHDPRGPDTVLHWVDLTRQDVFGEIVELGPHEDVPARLTDKLRQCTEAEFIAFAMQRWRKGELEHDVAPRKQTYSGAGMDVASLDEAARKAEHARGISELREAAFYTCEGTERLTKLGELEPAKAIELEAALATINRIADAHTPRRPNFAVQTALELPEPILTTEGTDR